MQGVFKRIARCWGFGAGSVLKKLWGGGVSVLVQGVF